MNGSNYKYSENDVCEVERSPLMCEQQISEIFSLISRLEDKVRHISLMSELRDGNNKPREIKPALNTMLDEVIERLGEVVGRIQN